MNWNTHSELKGSHAIMSASQPYWLNDSDDKFIERFNKFEAAARGTRLHDPQTGERKNLRDLRQ